MKNLSKKQKYIYLIVFIILLGCFIIIGKKEYTIESTMKNKTFDEEYSEVSKDNVFKYAYSSQVYSKIKSGNCIVLFGFKENEFIGKYANIINEIAKEKNIKEILYYDFKNDRDNQNATYESIVNYLIDYLYKDDEGNIKLTSPSLLIIKNNKILYYDDETSYVPAYTTSKSYWNEYNINNKKSQLNYIFDLYLEEE